MRQRVDTNNSLSFLSTTTSIPHTRSNTVEDVASAVQHPHQCLDESTHIIGMSFKFFSQYSHRGFDRILGLRVGHMGHGIQTVHHYAVDVLPPSALLLWGGHMGHGIRLSAMMRRTSSHPTRCTFFFLLHLWGGLVACLPFLDRSVRLGPTRLSNDMIG
jgi:hypothetical protein